MGIMTTIFVIIIITMIFINIIGFGAQGKSEFSGTVSHPKVQTLSNRTPNQQLEGHTTGEEGGIPWGAGGGGGGRGA